MKLAIIGSRSITSYQLEEVIPDGVTRIADFAFDCCEQ